MEDMNEIAIQYRGRIIHSFTVLEFMIDTIIVCHFAGKTGIARQEMMYQMVGDKLDFESKKRAFDYIIETYHSVILDKNPSLLKDISEMQKIRNIMAHRKLLTTPDRKAKFDGDKITLEVFSSERKGANPKRKIRGRIIHSLKPVEFDKKFVNEYVGKCNRMYKVLNDILDYYDNPRPAGGN